MKELQAAGIGIAVKQADPISMSHEEQLWDKGLLGDQTPATPWCFYVALILHCGVGMSTII